ncbi:MAG TPA: DUF817 domain-containing protein [Methylomirabilota bacterium]|nr:DUF817 domain-containing protein [Methylomirabilota bacterium]
MALVEFALEPPPDRLPRPIERAARCAMARLPGPIGELLMFGVKQGWACLFGGLMLALLLGTHLVWQSDWPVHRYDALFLAAVCIQALFLATGLETPAEARTILLFHIVGTAMEVFKTGVGSWTYPEEALIRIAGVPLFSGFMYASVGSYMVRAMRICDMRFAHYPSRAATVLLAVAIYVNFFSHHWILDMRWALFAATVVMYRRVAIVYTVDAAPRTMPLVVAALLTAVFLWIAENVGTATGTWIYPGSGEWRPVSLSKYGSWYLLLYVSLVLVTLVSPPRAPSAALSVDCERSNRRSGAPPSQSIGQPP